MKKISIVALVALLSGCCSSEDESAAISGNGGVSRDVTLRAYASGDVEIEYPVSIDVYDSEGNIAGQETIDAETGGAAMSLMTGHYTIVAKGGDSDFTNGYTTSRPLMMGTKEVSLTADLTESISMKYMVASVRVILSDMEEDVTDVTVTVGPQYAAISPRGEYSGEISPVVSCTKEDDGKWVTGVFYVLPGTGSNTSITIRQTSPKGIKEFNVAYPAPLEAGKPYIFNGSYNNSFASYVLNITISAEGWSDDIVSDFEFDDNGGTIIPTTPESPDTPITGDALTAGTLWNGHIVALVEGNTATLLSTEEWTLSDVDNLPESEMAAYSEGDITGWSLPTEAQGLSIAEKYRVTGDNFDLLNSLLEGNSIKPLNGGNASLDIRYLCGDGAQAVSLRNVNVVTTSNKTRDYRIRLVKTITIQ